MWESDESRDFWNNCGIYKKHDSQFHLHHENHGDILNNKCAAIACDLEKNISESKNKVIVERYVAPVPKGISFPAFDSKKPRKVPQHFNGVCGWQVLWCNYQMPHNILELLYTTVSVVCLLISWLSSSVRTTFLPFHSTLCLGSSAWSNISHLAYLSQLTSRIHLRQLECANLPCWAIIATEHFGTKRAEKLKHKPMMNSKIMLVLVIVEIRGNNPGFEFAVVHCKWCVQRLDVRYLPFFCK
jgi:hypothetical protein